MYLDSKNNLSNFIVKYFDPEARARAVGRALIYKRETLGSIPLTKPIGNKNLSGKQRQDMNENPLYSNTQKTEERKIIFLPGFSSLPPGLSPGPKEEKGSA